MTQTEKLLKLLNERKVKYIVIGAAALTAHGWTRATQDLDFFVGGVRDFDEVWQRRVQCKLSEIEAPFVGLDDLLNMKRAANRAKDQEDIRQLEAIRKNRKPGKQKKK